LNTGSPTKEDDDETDTRLLTFWTSDIHNATTTDMPSVLAKNIGHKVASANPECRMFIRKIS